MKAMLYHEIWRDEMRALSIAIESADIFQLFQNLRNEGHPVLWYLLLKIAYSIFHSTLVLPILSYIFSAGIAFYMLFKSPFPLLFSCLLVFGFWGMYEYGIVSRNYGIAAFFMLCFADVFTRKKKAVLLQCTFLFLAIQCNYYASVMGMFLSFYLFLVLFKENNITIKNMFYLLLPLLSFIISSFTCMPDSNSIVSEKVNYFSDKIYNIWELGYGFKDLIFYWFPYSIRFLTFILSLSILIFINNKRALICYLGSLLFMSYFSLHIHQALLHHIGMWIYFAIVLLWIHYNELISTLKSKSVSKYLSGLGLLAFIFIIANNFHRGRYMLRDDVRALKSDSKAAASILKQFGKHTIFIAEPDYILESVMYYNYHPFYIPREKKFNSFVHFTKSNASYLSLNQLLNVADSFEYRGQKTTLIFNYKLSLRDSILKYSYDKIFETDSASFNDFNNTYQLMDSANGNWYTDERYFIYTRKKQTSVSDLK